MELSAKDKVLIAFYLEYQKDEPVENMEEAITAAKLGLEYKVLSTALKKLKNEGLVVDVVFANDIAFYKNAFISKDGIDYIETKVGIDKTLKGIEKIKFLASKIAACGWSEFKDIVAKTMAEIAKN